MDIDRDIDTDYKPFSAVHFQMDFEGLSGRIRYESGRRFDFNLDLLHLTQNGLRKVRASRPSLNFTCCGVEFY